MALVGPQPEHGDVTPGTAFTMDVDVHGVTVRLVDAARSDVELVQRQLPGVEETAGVAAADVVVRFVDSVSTHGTVRRIGADLVDDEGLVLARPGAGSAARARVRLDDGAAEVVCERHVREVPLLIGSIRMAALRKGLLPFHAVAFCHRGVGIAATGWSGSGKTAVLMAMLADGAVPVAAEWALVGHDGEDLLGVPQQVRLKPSHVRRWPELARVTKPAAGVRQRVLSTFRPVAGRIPRLDAAIERALHVDVPFDRLASGVGVHRWSRCAPFDAVLLLEDAEVPEATVERVSAEYAVDRIAVGLEHDLAELRDARRVLRFAWGRPVADSLGVETADAAHRALLARHLMSRPAFLIRHRQPTAFAELRAVVEQAMP